MAGQSCQNVVWTGIAHNPNTQIPVTSQEAIVLVLPFNLILSGDVILPPRDFGHNDLALHIQFIVKFSSHELFQFHLAVDAIDVIIFVLKFKTN